MVPPVCQLLPELLDWIDKKEWHTTKTFFDNVFCPIIWQEFLDYKNKVNALQTNHQLVTLSLIEDIQPSIHAEDRSKNNRVQQFQRELHFLAISDTWF